MKITNKLGLPLAIVEAVTNNSYSRGESDFTATQLIEPSRIFTLKRKHEDELEEDASSLIYSLQGQSIHTILERAAKNLKEAGLIAEERFYITLKGKKIGAQIDIYDPKTGILQDYKVTSVYSVKDGPKEEYAQQMNIQAEIMRQNGYTINKLQIVAILRDWSKGEYERDEYGTYPEHQVKVLDVPLISSEEVIDFILSRIESHQEATINLPLCTKEERWAKDDKYAVIKKGQKKAYRLTDTNEAAIMILESLEKEKYEVIKRPGVSTRCNLYCPVANFCDQYKKEKKENE
jgi:hypothetical protein